MYKTFFLLLLLLFFPCRLEFYHVLLNYLVLSIVHFYINIFQLNFISILMQVHSPKRMI